MRPPVCGQLASLVELAEPLAGAEARKLDGRIRRMADDVRGKFETLWAT